ncbi:DUF4232 domain-containing protein [Frankia sp. CNm7]|uniref:DUF4232 domain-containing protein n=1 Tax=Frankia nepalensis TaxID=1836974 RepID=A0A937RFS7_9ACTN|nr:DUF4232 domain-containing protein [Frankia nepalensis]MBL7501725.1 DUF4232 domain-containing protein [Frankia nepalensis]MBL7514343.1 DUF4232 domain-containing protein [Frankia nepalensis]MBL7519126.1 DUF4232 domain-containing protein [Frankia nepalensis]MBL7631368.1 DUF4232 domain-containing protein [Frankia nepalensis]
MRPLAAGRHGRALAAVHTVAALAAAAALGSAGCSRSGSSEGFPVDVSTPSPTARPVALAATATPTGPGAAAAGTTRATGPAGGASAAAGRDGEEAGPPRCTGATLIVTLRPPVEVASLAPGTTQFAAVVTFTNDGPAACAMYGYPGAALVTAAGEVYDLPRRASAPPDSVQLPPGGSADAVLVFLPTAAAPAGAPAFDAGYLLITPPDDRDPVRLDWPGGPVVDQRDSAYPASYVTPVTG